ncbi:MAG: hypothetical protein ACJ72D_11345, partial [Marmoricola sp.]
LVASPTGLAWKDTARKPSTTYTYTVAALDAVGTVSSSASVTVRTLADTIRPSVPANFHRISRSGAYVTLRTSLRVYSATTNTFRAWAGKYVAVAYRSCSTCPWHQLRTLTTDSAGRAGYRFSSSRSREYRVRASGTSLAWEPLSRYIRL